MFEDKKCIRDKTYVKGDKVVKEKPDLNWVKGCDALRVRFHPYEFPTCERKGEEISFY